MLTAAANDDIRFISPRSRQTADGENPPIVCLERVWAQNAKLVQAILERGWRPVNAAITSVKHLLKLNPALALIRNDVNSELYMKLRRQGCHIVRWIRCPDPADELSCMVCADHRAYGKLAAEHFAERGFRQAAYLGWNATEELAPLMQGLQERGAELELTTHLYDLNTSTAKRDGHWWGKYELHLKDFRAWLARVNRPIGILTMDDRLAARCCMHCHELGLTVPVDVAILGIGNRAGICDCAPVPVSSIIPDTDSEIAACIELLSRGLKERVVKPEHILCPPQGIALRDSTDILASVDRNIAMALRFIWKNYRRNISVDDIATAAGMPRFQLERSFRKNLNRGVGAELRQRRMEVFVELLRTTDIPITTICSFTGFFSPPHLFRRFKRTYGMTPQQYRDGMTRPQPTS